MDQIIVVSNHSKYGFDTSSYDVSNSKTGEKIDGYKCTTPVHVVNYAIRSFQPEDMGIDFETDFNFLCVSQWGIRKNLENTILWFLDEFKNDEVGLVLKINRINNSLMDHEHVHDSLSNLLKYICSMEI